MKKETCHKLSAQVIENLEDAVLAVHQEGFITLFNPAAQALFRRSERQALGKSYQGLFSNQERLLYLIRTTLSQGRTISDHENIFLEHQQPPSIPLSVSVSPIFTDAGIQEGAVLIARDLSRIRQLEEAIHRADRLSTLGTLAAGLAHEIKNPLGGIKGAAQLLDRELEQSDPLREFTKVMVREVERVNGIIEELMDLSRPQPLQLASVNLNEVLDHIVLLQKEAHREKAIDFIITLDPSIPPILGNRNQLTQLFLNLIKNAGEAIDREGTVEVVSRVASDYHMQRPGSRPFPLIVIEIRDTGAGIPAERQEQIFTPFYTSKDQGSGLGLSICQKIVQEHDGFIKLESAEGKGTTFAVYLPHRS